MAEAGRPGGPIEPPLFTVLERRRAGEGDGGMLDNVSVVRSDNEGRCLRCSRGRVLSIFSTVPLVAFSLPLLTTATSAFVLGGVVSSEP